MKTYKELIKEYDDRTDRYVADEIKRRKLAKVIVNATDDKRMIKGKADFTMDHHTGSSTIHVYLRKMPGPTKGVVAYNYDLRFESVEEAHSAAQQAAIAIDMKKKGKKPKNEAQGTCWDGYEQRGMKKKGDKMVPNCVPVGEENIEEKNVPTNPSLWSRAKSLAKSKFDVYPSAYANGWAAKWYKSKGGGWKKA